MHMKVHQYDCGNCIVVKTEAAAIFRLIYMREIVALKKKAL